MMARYNGAMSTEPSPLSNWTPKRIASGRAWAENWKRAGKELERIERAELRRLDGYKAIELLCHDADYTVPPLAPLPTSGLVEQQRLFMKAGRRRT
jgi:hypothetical protein